MGIQHVNEMNEECLPSGHNMDRDLEELVFGIQPEELERQAAESLKPPRLPVSTVAVEPPPPPSSEEPRPDKQCRCKRSKCLKLYCECFAANVFCVGCKCTDCHNNEEHASSTKGKRCHRSWRRGQKHSTARSSKPKPKAAKRRRSTFADATASALGVRRSIVNAIRTVSCVMTNASARGARTIQRPVRPGKMISTGAFSSRIGSIHSK